MRFAIKLKVFAVLLTIISGIIVTSVIPPFNEGVLMIIYGRKYSKLDQALNELSLFQTNNVTKQTVSDLHFSQPGFKEMLDVIQKRRVIQSKESDITFIFILETGTGIQLGGLWANPSLVLGLLENKKPEFVSVLYENDLQAWIEDEKRGDLQTFSFFILVFE